MLHSITVNNMQSHDTSPWRSEVPRGDERLKREIKVKKREKVRRKSDEREGREKQRGAERSDGNKGRTQQGVCRDVSGWGGSELCHWCHGRSHKLTLCCSTASCLAQNWSFLSASSTSATYICVDVAWTHTDTDTLPRKQARRCHSASVKARVWPFQSLDSHSNC